MNGDPGERDRAERASGIKISSHFSPVKSPGKE
jgi:hypothetical protein